MGNLREEEMLNLAADRQYSMGRSRFVFRHGILLFGIPVFCVMSGFEWYSHQLFNFKGIALMVWLLFSLGCWCAIGYYVGSIAMALDRTKSIAFRELNARGRITGNTDILHRHPSWTSLA